MAGGAFSWACHRRHFVTTGLLAAAACCLAGMATRRCFDFQDEYVFWRKAMLQAPRKGRVMLNLGVECQESLMFDRAEKLIRRVLRLYPKRGTAHHHLGKLLLLRREPEKAITSFLAAIEHDPQVSPNVYVDAAAALYKLKRHDEAMSYVELAKKQKLPPSGAWYWAGRIHRARGEIAEANANLAEAKRRRRQEMGGLGRGAPR